MDFQKTIFELCVYLAIFSILRQGEAALEAAVGPLPPLIVLLMRAGLWLPLGRG
jgi:hypothetical protein